MTAQTNKRENPGFGSSPANCNDCGNPCVGTDGTGKPICSKCMLRRRERAGLGIDKPPGYLEIVARETRKP